VGNYDVTFAKDPVGTVSEDDLYIVTAAVDGTLVIKTVATQIVLPPTPTARPTTALP